MEDQKEMISKTALVASIIFIFVIYGSAYSAVKIYLDGSRQEYVMAEELDCKVYEGRTGLTIGFKASTLFFDAGPELKLGGTNNIEWDRAVHGIIARYKELCTRFNSGAITMKEYNERLEQIDKISKEALELQERMIKGVKMESKDAFGELEMETKDSKGTTPYNISRSIDNINKKLIDLK
jgi:hypothetical protein